MRMTVVRMPVADISISGVGAPRRGRAEQGDDGLPDRRIDRSQPRKNRVDLSVVIKSFNEEAHIEECLRSIFAGCAELSFEIILADARSTDRTVEIAKRFPITIVQLAHDRNRSCGAGGQLGYQFACGGFILLMDGDMVLNEGFVSAGVAVLDREQDLAAVAGTSEEQSNGLEYRLRRARPDAIGYQECLNGSALYRASAIRSIGYFTNRNLHCREEWELGKRLSARGWRLRRIPVPAYTHYGHADPPFQFLRNRWATKYVYGYGELIRASRGQPYFWQAVRTARKLLVLISAWLAVVALIATDNIIPGGRWIGCALALLVVLLAIIRKRGVQAGLYSLCSWNLHAAGLLMGLLRRQQPPTQPIAATVIAEAPATPIGVARVRPIPS
jgi:glycosyltransferase involved in cell wall biosynthesis